MTYEELENRLREALDALDYLLQDEKEMEDFQEYPARNHVYYRCLYALYGKRAADAAYFDALDKLETEE